MSSYKQAKSLGGSDDGDQSTANVVIDKAHEMLGNAGVLDWMEWEDTAAEHQAPGQDVSALQEAPAGAVVDDGGGFLWERDSNGNFTCVGAPEGYEGAIGNVITQEGNPDAWAMLNDKYEAIHGSPEATPSENEGPAAEEDEGYLDWLIDAGEDIIETVGDGAAAIWDSVEDGAEELWDWAKDSPVGEAISDLWDGGDSTEAPTTNNPRTEERQRHLDEGKTDVLDEAIRLIDTSDAGHIYDGDRNQSPAEVRDSIRDGVISGLERIGCSEFVTAAMAAAGYDLDQLYLVNGLPVAYKQGSSARLVDMGMITNHQREATGAILAAQDGTTETIEAGSKEAKDLGLPDTTFRYAGAADLIGTKAHEDDLFGAGAAAVALGGYEVSGPNRKPGDVQQRQNVADGKYAVAGHAAIVHAVHGHGVALLGAAGSPTLDVEGHEGLSGWFRIENGVQMVVGPNTAPSTVGSLTAVEVQQIDANRDTSPGEDGSKRGSDATQVGDFAEDKADAA